MNLKLFWQSWNWPWYSRMCLLYWLHWHLAIKTSWLTVKERKYESQYCRLRIWKLCRIWIWCNWIVDTDYTNSPVSGWRIQNTVITGHFSQHRTNGASSSTPWMFQGHFDTGPSGGQADTQLVCIMFVLYPTTSPIIWMALCKLYPRRRLNGRKTNTSPYS
jgi:hypothetical protein